MVDIYNRAEVFLFPSQAEGFRMPNVEAMACECPVKTSSAFAIPEIGGKAALLLKNQNDSEEIAKKINELINNKRLREELIDMGFTQIKPYDWARSAEKMYRVYLNLLAQKGLI